MIIPTLFPAVLRRGISRDSIPSYFQSLAAQTAKQTVKPAAGLHKGLELPELTTNKIKTFKKSILTTNGSLSPFMYAFSKYE